MLSCLQPATVAWGRPQARRIRARDSLMASGDAGATTRILQHDPGQRQGQQVARQHSQQPPVLPPPPVPPAAAAVASLSLHTVSVRRYCPETDHSDVVHICRNVCECSSQPDLPSTAVLGGADACPACPSTSFPHIYATPLLRRWGHRRAARHNQRQRCTARHPHIGGDRRQRRRGRSGGCAAVLPAAPRRAVALGRPHPRGEAGLWAS